MTKLLTTGETQATAAAQAEGSECAGFSDCPDFDVCKAMELGIMTDSTREAFTDCPRATYESLHNAKEGATNA